MGGVADPKKYAPAHTCYFAERGRSALKGVGINTGEPQNWGALKLRPLETGRGDKPLPHVCYHIKFGRSASNGIRINRREPPRLGSAGTPPPCGGRR